MKVPFIDLKRGYEIYGEELEDAVKEVLRSCIYLNGPKTRKLEETLSDYLGVSFAIGVSSGTEALYLILKALELPENSYVLLPSFTFIATSEVVIRNDLIPYFVDVEEESYNISLESLKEAYFRLKKQGKRVSAVLAVSLFGTPARMEEIASFCEKEGLVLIEDICQAFGAKIKSKKIGSFGIASATSFYPSKVLSTCGDAGMVFISDEKLAEKIRYLREHGQTRPYFYEYHGVNGRIDELHSAILLVKFKYLEKELHLRNEIANFYLKELKKFEPYLKLPKVPENYFSVWSLFTIRAKNRDELREFLEKKGIKTGIYYSHPLHLQPVYKGLGFKKGDLPVTERISQEVLSLPMFPYLKKEELEYVVFAMKEFFRVGG